MFAFVFEFTRAKKIDGKVNKYGISVDVEIATLISKRILVKGKQTSTRYFCTFEFEESKKRIEFEVSGKEYCVIAESDKGYLDFQGEKFIRFERII